MRQIRVTKASRTRSSRRGALLDALPVDPRDPDIVRAKQRERGGNARFEELPGERQDGKES